ncbi:Alg9-like mannosyltransferase [Plectosphaerella cucumerina]|uniref:Mannosyltransferase n=1 Tax=Plectosphaerella cucumerina TaxID=40658 RepID=A0A8K0TT85_9PEZI|nr:Alg9-like mannosyltransferase [Plectosphaerella cucumerina]
MRSPADMALALILPGLILIHLLAAPYTKVEESFNIQAAHDILVYGTPTHDIFTRLHTVYDHFSFPGAVPRSFVGPVLLAGFAQPIVALVGFAYAQLVVRALLGLFNAASLLFFASRLERGLGRGVARWWILLTAGQFHIIFYASRTLPNMFAFGLTTFASALLLPHPDSNTQNARHRVAISIFVFAAVVFRSEVALLLGANGLYLLLTRHTTLIKLIPPFAISFIAALILSVPLDSYFWQKPLWPELWGFVYNVLHGGASNWGTSPWHYYFLSALPRLLLNPLVPAFLIPLACYLPATSRPARDLIVPPLIFVAIYSIQPHKETRFIFYAVPPLTAAAALAANFLFTRRAKGPLYAIPSALVALSIPASLAAATGILLLSSLNYPGGEALVALHDIIDVSPLLLNGIPAVHTDVLSCMTGVTLFLQNRPGLPLLDLEPSLPDSILAELAARHFLDFDKTEDPAVLLNPVFWSRFDYLLLEDPSKIVGDEAWDTVAVIEGYAGVEFLRPGSEPSDPEEGRPKPSMDTVLGKGRVVAAIKDRVRALTGGWWIGPRMEPRIHIMRKAPRAKIVVESA